VTVHDHLARFVARGNADLQPSWNLLVHPVLHKRNALLSASPRVLLFAAALTLYGLPSAFDPLRAQDQAAPAAPQAAPAPKSLQHFDIDDFQVEGADTLPQIEIEQAIYPFLGPNRTSDDVEKARAALEKAYHDKGFQTVNVAVPPQQVKGGVVILKVTEFKVAHLRVKGSRYFDPDKIKNKAQSLQEGTVPNFNDVTKDIVALNQWPDRRVTPALRAGDAPGTVDVDLNVEDKVPVHGSLEFNDRQSPNTTPDRVTATVHYDDLWQQGHSLSITYQVAPEDVQDAEALSVSYLYRLPNTDWLSFLTYGVKSNSNVAIIGGSDVIGPGEIFGERAVFTLPSRDNFFHTFSVGIDYKHFEQTVGFTNEPSEPSEAGESSSSPITYFPVVGTYSATFKSDQSLTQVDATITHGLRGIGSDPTEFDNRRFDSSGDFFVLKADVSHTQDLPEGFQLYGKAQGQLADQPLVQPEQFSLGGLDTVRGYLETEMLGDNGGALQGEFRSPDIGNSIQQLVNKANEGGSPMPAPLFNNWRVFGFIDAGMATIYDPLPEQTTNFEAWSYGAGTTFKLLDYTNGMIAYAIPKTTETFTRANDPRVLFRVWGEF
jgi:hemolysin activation/secretion protein